MKAILIHRQTAESPISGGLTIVPSSAMVMPGKSLFLPDFGENWTATPHTAYRLCRLGKTIDAKFANRYVDASTTVWLVRPTSSEVPASVMAAADYSMVVNEFQPITLTEADTICRTISDLSSYMTLQMGDIIVDAQPSSEAFALTRGADINGIRVR